MKCSRGIEVLADAGILGLNRQLSDLLWNVGSTFCVLVDLAHVELEVSLHCLAWAG